MSGEVWESNGSSIEKEEMTVNQLNLLATGQGSQLPAPAPVFDGGEKFKIQASEDLDKFKYIKRFGNSAARSSFRWQLLYGDLEHTLVDSDEVDSVALACEKWIKDHPSLRWKFVAYTTCDSMDEKLKGYLIKPNGAIGSRSCHAIRYIEKKNRHSAMALANALDCVKGAIIEAVSHDVCCGGYTRAGEKCNTGDDNWWKWLKVRFKTANDAQQVVGSGAIVCSSVGEEHEDAMIFLVLTEKKYSCLLYKDLGLYYIRRGILIICLIQWVSKLRLLREWIDL
ncbi:hypothetical protein OROHE_025637 [Orobanche hederae]